MDKRDQQFENFLREFVPERPGALREDRRPTVFWQRRFAAAAVFALACGAALWFSLSHHGHRNDLIARHAPTQNSVAALQYRVASTAYLQRLAFNDPAQFEAALTAASQNTLPRFSGPNSSLRVLAKD